MQTTNISLLRKRDAIIQKIRLFFINRAYLEVETPIISKYGITDLNLNQLKTECMQQTCYLQTSPEYAMKRLLAQGSGPIFQLAKVFRNDEKGRWHNPEFTMLEWYKLDVDHHGLIEEVDAFLQAILNTKPLVKISYQAVFQEYCFLNPHTASIKELSDTALNFNLGDVLVAAEKDEYLYLLMSHVIEPKLAELPYPTAVYDFPTSQACLARIINDKAARFEIYYQGVELANGFYELSMIDEQLERFQTDLKNRNNKNMNLPAIDVNFLAALKTGLPNCSGVALGVDRLIALALEKTSVKEVIAFDFDSA